MAEGWTWLLNARKWHYFKNSKISLCGKWMLVGNPELETGNDDSMDNCAACRRILTRIKVRKR